MKTTVPVKICVNLAFLGFLLGCPTSNGTQEQVVPVYRLSNLTHKSVSAKAISVNDANLDLAAVPFLSTMFQGFTTAVLAGSTYQTTVVDQPYAFTVTEAATGTKFESTTTGDNVNGLRTTLSVTVNSATQKFSVLEESIFDYNITVGDMGSGVIYRKVSTPEYSGIDSFHINVELKYYDWGTTDGGISYSAKRGASWVELFKNDQIFGLLIKSENIDETVGVKDPHQWDSTDLATYQSAMSGVGVKNNLASDMGKKYWKLGLTTEYSCIIIIYDLTSHSFEYKMSDGSGYFCGPIDVGDPQYHTNKPTIPPTNGLHDYVNRSFSGTKETLFDVLAKYNWNIES